MEHKIVNEAEWLKQSAAFLEKEKAFTRQRDELAEARRNLPWTPVEKNYAFESPNGQKTLSELFAGKSQLFLQHFMFAPDWKEGCPGCSFQGDHMDGALQHLNQRNVSFAAVSRAPLATIEAFRKRMGWKFPWVSAGDSDFNYDFHVSFTAEEKAKGEVFYNFGTSKYETEDLPGNSIFYKNEEGKIFRTYSSFARGGEMLITAYMMMDMLPKGRDEKNFKVHPMEWLRHHDKYEDQSPKKPCH